MSHKEELLCSNERIIAVQGTTMCFKCLCDALDCLLCQFFIPSSCWVCLCQHGDQKKVSQLVLTCLSSECLSSSDCQCRFWTQRFLYILLQVRLSSEKDSTCISPFVHPNVHFITCYSFMWPEMHASTEEFTWILCVRTPLVIASHNLFPRGQKDSLTTPLIHAN